MSIFDASISEINPTGGHNIRTMFLKVGRYFFYIIFIIAINLSIETTTSITTFSKHLQREVFK